MQDIYLSIKTNEEIENLRNSYLKELNNIEESNKNDEINLINSYLDLLLKAFEFDDLDFPLKYELLEEIWKKNQRVLLKFTRMLLSDNNIEYIYDYEKVIFLLVKLSLNNNNNLLREIKLDKVNNELWKWDLFDNPQSNKWIEIINNDLDLYIEEYNKTWNYIKTISNISNKFKSRNQDISFNNNIIINEDKTLDLIYKSLLHQEEFIIANDYLSNNLKDLKNIISNENKNNSKFKQILLFIVNLEFQKEWNISSELLELLKWFTFDIDDYELIEDVEEKENLLKVLKNNNDNYSLWLIFFSNDFKWVKETKKWLEEIVYLYKWYFVWFSTDEKVMKNTLDTNARKSKLKLVVYNKNITLYVLDKENRINNEVLVFNINNTITKDYFDKSMKKIIDDFFARKLNASKWDNFSIYQKSRFFLN